MKNSQSHDNNAMKQGQRRCAGAWMDRRGSAIVLVLVSIVLMATLAATLLQITRFERIPRKTSSIDAVVESVIDEIANQLTDDLLDTNGNLFNITYTPFNGGGDEPYDFPWTNPGNFYGRSVTEDGTTYNLYGGAMDDIWLASSMPDFRSAAQIPAGTYNNTTVTNTNLGVWRHITDLTGIYLRGSGNTSDLSTVATPNIDGLTNNNNVRLRDNNIPTNSALLVDADNDGIGDSRWAWAPLRQIGSIQYVMAVRIVDLSARMDMNVALGATPSVSGATLGSLVSRGDNPSELDAAAFVDGIANASGLTVATAMAEWSDAMDHRASAALGNTATYDNNASPDATPGSRYHFWERGASRTSFRLGRNGESGAGFDYTAQATFNLADAFELLHRNGLGSTTNSTAEDLMPTFLRKGTLEGNFQSATTVTNNNGQNWTQRDFWFLDPRKQLTPYSGSAAFNPPITQNEGGTLKIDVNAAVKTGPGRTALRNEIREVFNEGNPAQLLNRLRQFANTTELASQLTANITDYIDPDNALTEVDGQFGFEALPYITELYTQRAYDATAVNNNGATDTVIWSRPTNTAQGYALEIGNPFGRYDAGNSRWVGRPVKLSGVYLKLNGGIARSLVDHYGAPTELKPGEIFYLYRNSRGANDSALDDLSNYYSTTESGNFTTVHVATTIGPGLPANRTDHTFFLEAEVESNIGNPAGWAYCAVEFDVPATTGTIDEVLPAGTIPAPAAGGPYYQGFAITNYQGVGQGLRMMGVASTPQGDGNARGFGDETSSIDKPSLNCNTGGTGEAQRNITPRLAHESKPLFPRGYNGMADQQIVWHDNPRNRLQWVGDILQIPIIGPNGDAAGSAAHMSEAFFAANIANRPEGIEFVMLPYKRLNAAGTATLPAGQSPVINANASRANATTSYFGRLNLPHGLMLIERLATINPAMDGNDGDNQGEAETIVANAGNTSVDETRIDPDEALVPGKINFNTVSYDTLVSILPYPDLNTREQIAAAIINRRESLIQNNTHGIGANDLAGIQYTSALYEQIERLGVNPSRVAGDTINLGGTRIDHNDYEDSPGVFASVSGTPLEDGVINDREEEIMLAKWLTEVGSVRSDIFAAYIVVQGYTADDFQSGVKESKQLVVIFSRANVKGSGDKAVEIGRFEYE